jgi:hypothetical protein
MRRFAALALFALVAAAPFSVRAATASNVAKVAAVQPTRVADLILLDRGFDAGLREGMVCRISRGTTEIADVQLVEIRPRCSAALILSLAPSQAIRTGDAAAIKIIKTQL